MSAIFLTGAPATGKTTIIQNLIEQGASLLPRHTTRLPRLSDLSGEYAYLSREPLLWTFLCGGYLEEHINTLQFGGQLYATPNSWISDTVRNPHTIRVASPPSLAVARCLMQCLPRDAQWIHLVAPSEVREERLRRRGIPPEEISYRLTAGEVGVHDPIQEATLSIDTAKSSIDGAIYTILQLAGRLL